MGRTVWSPIVEGDAIGIEIVLAAALTDTVSVELKGVSHIVSLPTANTATADPAPCEPVDALCSSVRQCELNAALRLSFTDVQGNSYVCSATVVNDHRSVDEKLASPSVLTSNECLSTAYDVGTVVAHWNLRSTVCGGGTLTSQNRQLSGGADLIVSDPASNHTLLRLRDAVPTDTDHCLAGWSADNEVVGETVFSIHPRPWGTEGMGRRQGRRGFRLRGSTVTRRSRGIALT